MVSYKHGKERSCSMVMEILAVRATISFLKGALLHIVNIQ